MTLSSRRLAQLLVFVAGCHLNCGSAAAQAIDWTPAYIGAQIGYSWDNINIYGDSPLTIVGFNSNSVIGGIQGGKNLIQQNGVVIGFVADFNWLEASTSASTSKFSTEIIDDCGESERCFVTTTTSGTQTRFDLDVVWKSSLRAKAGVLVTPTVLLYTTGGVAFARLKANYEQTTTPPPVTTSLSEEATLMGYVIGGGTEFKISPNIGLFTQVLYYGFDHKDFNVFGSNLRVGLDETVAEVGISYYFN